MSRRRPRKPELPEKNFADELAAIQVAHPTAMVEVWAMDEHRVGLLPIVRRVWAPRGQRPVAPVQTRYQWRYLVGWVHPASGHAHWHWTSTMNQQVFSAELTAFAEQVGAGPARQIALVLDGAGWHHCAQSSLIIQWHFDPTPVDRRVGNQREITREGHKMAILAAQDDTSPGDRRS